MEKHMADPVPSGSDVSAGTYTCTKCGYELKTGSTEPAAMPAVRQRVMEHGDRRRQRQRPRQLTYRP
jgi:hypothetical protein